MRDGKPSFERMRIDPIRVMAGFSLVASRMCPVRLPGHISIAIGADTRSPDLTLDARGSRMTMASTRHEATPYPDADLQGTGEFTSLTFCTGTAPLS
jgi:hypothetical protein